MLIDSHAHLTSPRFDKDREKLIKNLRKNNIEVVITSGSSVASSVASVSLAKKYNNIFASVGIHPVNTNEMDENTIVLLKTLANNKNVVAIGEIGLDYHYDYVSKVIQKKWFRRQINLAKELKLPIVVHDREANIDTYNIIKDELDSNLKGVIHCYSGDVKLARKYAEMEFYISISGPVTYKNAKKLKKVAKEIPLRNLFIETDSPSLTPAPLYRKRNEPLYVSYVAAMIAELKDVSVKEVEKRTTENVKRLYKLKSIY
ncbi:MAG: TatD family deoxyribonuclease [Firmicutes bacterium]|nr:TatD family deoxyribonuclease [Bacillota bacterium]